MAELVVAFCTYNRADRLHRLVSSLKEQRCPVEFEILAINNNSTDRSLEVLEGLQRSSGPSIRIVSEFEQGIVPARNRAISEAIESKYLVFIDDDEIPLGGWLSAAYHALAVENAECVGGKIEIDFGENPRPSWLDSEIAGFLGQVDYGTSPFWVRSDDTPLWTGNIAYSMKLFRDAPELRFDTRYNRAGSGIGGGEDVVLFRELCNRGVRIRYRADMAILHSVEPWKLRRRYFLHRHFLAGLKQGEAGLPEFENTTFGIPPFLLRQAIRAGFRGLGLALGDKPGALRQFMNAGYALGSALGYRLRS